MRTLVQGFVLWFSLALAGLAAAAFAADPVVPVPSAKAVQLIVRAQLDAFANDDAKRAFSYAALTIQQMFGNSDNFLDMVRTTYPVVYRPKSVTFLTPKPQGKEVVQPVHMTDGQGASWLAVYRLEQQKDKSWRIAGCVLVPNGGQTV